MILRRHAIERICDEGIAMLQDLRDQAGELSNRAHSDRDLYVRSGGVGQKSPTYADDGTRPGPTPAASLNSRTDTVELVARHFMANLGRARTAIRQAEADSRRLRPLKAKAARELAELGRPMGGGHCGNPGCGRWVSNSGTDRLKKGRCSGCYKWRRDHDGEERPRERCHPGLEETG